jgi:head-tail adaptor
MKARKLKAGDFDQRVRIEKEQLGISDAYGVQAVTWVTHATVWAQVTGMAVRNSEATTQAVLPVSTRRARVCTRWFEGVTAAMRVVQIDRGNRIWQIVTEPTEIGRKESLEFLAESYSTI